MWSEVGESVPYGEALDLVRELRKEWASHLVASESGWSWVSSLGDIVATLHAESYINVHREDTFRLPKPWDNDAPAVVVTDVERAELVEKLERRSAFRDR